MSPKAIAIATENVKSAGVGKFVSLEVKPLSQWNEAPANGVLVTNPPYGERISSDDMEGLYSLIGQKLKQIFTGYHAWIIGYREEYFQKIGLAPSLKEPIFNGALECELREYVIFEGDYKSFRREGGHLKTAPADSERHERVRRTSDREWRDRARRGGFGGKSFDRDRKAPRKGESKYAPTKGRFAKTVQREEPSENPLAARRNVHALKGIIGRKPSLSEDKTGVTFRPRRRWKRPGQSEEGND